MPVHCNGIQNIQQIVSTQKITPHISVAPKTIHSPHARLGPHFLPILHLSEQQKPKNHTVHRRTCTLEEHYTSRYPPIHLLSSMSLIPTHLFLDVVHIDEGLIVGMGCNNIQNINI
jgi:hypothetical protein